MIRPVKGLVKKGQDLDSEGAPKTPLFPLHADEAHLTGMRAQAHCPLPSERASQCPGPAQPLTIVHDEPVLPGQAQLLLPLPHDFLHFRRKAVGIAGKHEGVAVGTGAIEVEEAAGVLHGIGVIVRVDDPVVIICKPESHGANVPPLVGSGVKETHYQAQEIRLPETGLFH